MAGYYRPVIDSNTASTIDANALKGAISSMGSFFGQGQLKTRPKYNSSSTGSGEQDPMSQYGGGNGQPDMEYYTTGGRFWDRLNNRQAEMANAQLQGQRFNQQLDLFGNQQRLGQQSAFNSAERLGINRDANANAASTYNFNQSNPQLPQAIAQAVQKVILNGQLAGQTAANATGATTSGIIAQHQRPGLENQQIQAATNHTNQQTTNLHDLLPFQTAGLGYDNRIKQAEADNANALQQARINEMVAQTALQRAHATSYDNTKPWNQYKIAPPGSTILDLNTGNMFGMPLATETESSLLQPGVTNAVPIKGVTDLTAPPVVRPIPGWKGGVGKTNATPGTVGGAPYGKTISADKLKKLQAILNEP